MKNSKITIAAALMVATSASPALAGRVETFLVSIEHQENFSTRCIKTADGNFRFIEAENVVYVYSDGRRVPAVQAGTFAHAGGLCNPRTGSATTANPQKVRAYPSLQSQLALKDGTWRAGCQNSIVYVLTPDGRVTPHPEQPCTVGEYRRNESLASN